MNNNKTVRKFFNFNYLIIYFQNLIDNMQIINLYEWFITITHILHILKHDTSLFFNKRNQISKLSYFKMED